MIVLLPANTRKVEISNLSIYTTQQNNLILSLRNATTCISIRTLLVFLENQRNKKLHSNYHRNRKRVLANLLKQLRRLSIMYKAFIDV